VKGQEKLQNFDPPKWTLYNSGQWIVDMPDKDIDQDNDDDVDKAPAGLKNVAFARTAIFAGDGRIGKTLISEAKAIKCCMKLKRDFYLKVDGSIENLVLATDLVEYVGAIVIGDTDMQSNRGTLTSNDLKSLFDVTRWGTIECKRHSTIVLPEGVPRFISINKPFLDWLGVKKVWDEAAKVEKSWSDCTLEEIYGLLDQDQKACFNFIYVAGLKEVLKDPIVKSDTKQRLEKSNVETAKKRNASYAEEMSKKVRVE